MFMRFPIEHDFYLRKQKIESDLKSNSAFKKLFYLGQRPLSIFTHQSLSEAMSELECIKQIRDVFILFMAC